MTDEITLTPGFIAAEWNYGTRPESLPTPNLPLLRKVLDHIDAHPEQYDQTTYASGPQCKTAYCVAGHALVMTGHTLHMDENYTTWLDGKSHDTEDIISNAAQEELGLTHSEAYDLFDEINSRETVQRIAEQIAARAGERL